MFIPGLAAALSALGLHAGDGRISNFEFVFSLFGLLLGLALAEVLGGLGTAIQSRRKVRIGWLTPLLGLLIALDLTSFWTIAWNVREVLPAKYFPMLCGFAITGLYYLIARLAFPHDLKEWPDFDVYYFAHKKLVLGGIMLCNVLAHAGQAALGYVPFSGVTEPWASATFYVALVVAIFAKGRTANIVLLAVIAAMYPLYSAIALVLG